MRGILRNPTYKGSVVGQKSAKISFRSKKRKFFKPKDMIVVEDMHEPIIAPDEWELVQRLITSRKNGTGDSQKYDNIFCGLLKCPDAVTRWGLPVIIRLGIRTITTKISTSTATVTGVMALPPHKRGCAL